MQIIVSGSQDNTIKFWNLKTGDCLNTILVPRPYEGTNIVGARGLTESEKTSLKLLGAVETKEIRVLPIQEILTSHIPQREAEINIQSLPEVRNLSSLPSL